MARYYQTLYAGPKLFAVDDNDVVYYHDKEKWIPYRSARNITYSYDPDFIQDENEYDDNYSLLPDFNCEQMINKNR
ncbi:unnamed protein product, partial [Rotaria sordida]